MKAAAIKKGHGDERAVGFQDIGMFAAGGIAVTDVRSGWAKDGFEVYASSAGKCCSWVNARGDRHKRWLRSYRRLAAFIVISVVSIPVVEGDLPTRQLSNKRRNE